MAHEFHSGIMMNGERAWHGLGEVIEGTLPAGEAFTRAGALFPVGVTKLFAQDNEGEYIELEDRRAIWRPDTRTILGVASNHYKPIQNNQLLRFAEAIREEVDMDTVVVLRGGAKVAFTARLRGSEHEVVPGDKIHRNIVGYLGHDGKTAFGGMFTNIRVVCANTLGFAQSDANRHGKQFTIRHTANDIAQIDHVLQNIDTARQSFVNVVDDYRAMQSAPMSYDLFRHWLEDVYTLPAQNGRPGRIEDLPRKWKQLEHAWNYALGSNIPGVRGTVYAGLNAVTEVESSMKTKGAGSRRMHSALFGGGSLIIKKAHETALELAK
jgi:phage/plasmid-like protein (TIGR03299 family)